MPDVVHDPDTDWCACEPYSLRRCEYRMLADAVGDAFNPPDGDEGEVSILITAIENAAAYIAGQPCACTPEGIADQMPCPRCFATGRLGDKEMQR
jgi:hypothetical protein